ncbi:MAG: hypothetical protein J6W80_06065 [Kiritimatiellae bacterium]|nr:hypothetical protein [Kiritimatiellia bacterium]
MTKTQEERLDGLFGRGRKADAAIDEAVDRRLKEREDIDALATQNAFVRVIGAMLDDLCLFALDTGLLSEYGQGIRAAANRIKERLLVSKKGAEMLAKLAAEELFAVNRTIEKNLSTNKKETKKQ